MQPDGLAEVFVQMKLNSVSPVLQIINTRIVSGKKLYNVRSIIFKVGRCVYILTK